MDLSGISIYQSRLVPDFWVYHVSAIPSRLGFIGTMAAVVQTARRLIFTSKHRLGHFPRVANAAKNSPVGCCSSGLSQDVQFSVTTSSRRLRGACALGQSLLPWHSATAAACLVSRLRIDENPLEGMLRSYVSPI